MQYWAVIDNERKGPMSLEELKGLGITPSTLVWREGLNNWIHAKELEELTPMFEALTAPQQPAPEPQPESEPEPAPQPEPVPEPQPIEQPTETEWQRGFTAGWQAAHGASAQPQEPVSPTIPSDPCPPTYMWLAITILVVGTMCCCNPFGLLGIVPLVYATKVKSAYNMGDIEQANEYSQKALWWGIGAVAGSIVLGLIYWCLTMFLNSDLYFSQYSI